MIDLTPERIKEIAGAALLAGGPSRVSADDMPKRIVVDSREVEKGDLFVGLPGARHDGGRFAEQAAAAGAWGVLARPEHGLGVASATGARVRVFGVDDPLAALGRLARAWVDRLWAEGCRVVAVTGSTGKTSTKDILVALLEPHFEGSVRFSPRNFNTEIGLPLAVLSAEPGTRVLVLEMAMRGSGQIKQLCEIAPPEIGVITNVGPVHLELLGTVEAVAEAKAELIAALPPDGVCVVPAVAEALRPHLRKEVRTLTFANWPPEAAGPLGEVERVAQAAADVRALDVERVEVDGRPGLRAEIAVGAEQVSVEFNFTQAHNVMNALAAIGVGHALGVPTAALAEGARSVRLSDLRGEWIELPDEIVVINDCYNANPISMRAALDHLAETATAGRDRRTVAVLGEMGELGERAPEFHHEVGAYAAAKGVAALVAVGMLADGYVAGYGDAGTVHRATDAAEAAAVVKGLLEPRDVVLVKGSRSVGLEQVAAALRDGAEDGS